MDSYIKKLLKLELKGTYRHINHTQITLFKLKPAKLIKIFLSLLVMLSSQNKIMFILLLY